MRKEFLIGFFFALVLLIVSEYFFLQELYMQKREWVLLITLLGFIVSAILLRYLYKHYRNSSG